MLPSKIEELRELLWEIYNKTNIYHIKYKFIQEYIIYFSAM